MRARIRTDGFIGFYFPSMRLERDNHSIVSMLSQARPASTSPEPSVPQKELSPPSLVASSSENTGWQELSLGRCPRGCAHLQSPELRGQNARPWSPA